MPPIPQFAKVLAKRAKAKPKPKPKVFTRASTIKRKKRHLEQPDKVSLRPKKRIRCAEAATVEEANKKLLKNSIPEKPGNSSYDTIDLLKIESSKKLEDYRTGEKVKIYNSDNRRQFVEIVWPDDPLVSDLLSLVKKQIKDKKIQQTRGG